MPGNKNAWIGGVFLLVLSACGSGDACDRPQEYVYSKSGEKLVVPAGVSAPDPAKNRAIPPLSGERKERSNPCTVLPPELVVEKSGDAASGQAASANAAPSPARNPIEIGEAFNGGPLATLNAWIDAWARADIPSYLAFYSTDYRTPDGAEDRDTFLRQRTELLESTGPSQISIHDVTFEDLALGRKLVRLVQEFKVAEASRSIIKIIELVPEGGGYRIRQEWVVGYE